MKVYKNFLKKEDFNYLKSILISSNFPWFFNNVLNKPFNEKEKNNYQFVHTFYDNDQFFSNQLKIVELFKEKIEWLTLVRAKANLLTRTEKNIEHGMHIDFYSPNQLMTGIFYVNTNNGYTKFKNGTIIKSEQNKYIEFDSKLEHTGSTCTDSKQRIVINLNYFK
jgi:hypothetical protein